MASESRTAARRLALLKSLKERPYAHGFYRTVRQLECAHPEHPRLGESRRPADDPIRLGQEPSLAFATSTLASCDTDKKGRPELAVSFFGVFGANGPMPVHVTEYVRDRMRNSGDTTLVSFANLFHHRMLSLFYRAWANSQPTVSFDRPDLDDFARYVSSLVGLGMDSLRARDAMPDHAKLYFAGRLSQQTRNAEGLRAMLKDYFRLPVDIEEFVGEWIELPENGQCRLGDSLETGTLDMNVIIGARKWERQHKFRIVFGPLTMAQYEGVLPGGKTLAELTSLVRNYVGDALAFDVSLILQASEVPELKLGESARLGWTSWVLGGTVKNDAEDLQLIPHEYI